MRYDRLILIGLAVLLLVTLIFRSRPGRFEPARTASLVTLPVTGYVRVRGAVKHPGMYPVTANMMATDVIILAEPLPAIAVGALAAFSAVPVAVGDAIELIKQPGNKLSLVKGVIPVAERLVMGIPLDINIMSELDFDRVPGIGPAMAKRIVECRQKNGGFMRKMDLVSVEGIGEKKYAALSSYFK